jgi:hypothetical protein
MTDTAFTARSTTAGGVDVVRADELDWGESLVKHRHASAMRHKRLFDGETGSPNNFGLALADESSEYYSPSHRHLWDQVRYCIEGAVPIGRSMSVHAGEVAYFPEGVRYGPQEGGPDRLVLVLQFGGASRNGYLSPEQIDEGRSALERVGRFDGGLFRRDDDGRAQQDAYEAVWEQVLGVPAVYPDAVVQAPIVLNPSAFPAAEVDGCPGVRRRALGTFEPRRLGLEVIDLDPGAGYPLGTSGATVLGWVIAGSGNVDGERVTMNTALRCRDGGAGTLTATGDTSVLLVTLPTL